MRSSILIIGDESTHINDLFSRLIKKYHNPFLSPPLTGNISVSDVSLTGFNTIVLSPGNVYPSLNPDFQIQLRKFVEKGGLLICLPFTAYSVQFHGNDILGEIIPVKCDSFIEDKEIKILESSLVRARNAPSNIQTTSINWVREKIKQTNFRFSFESIFPKPDAEILGSLSVEDSEIPFGVRWNFGHGQVLYFNASYHSHLEHTHFFSQPNGEESLIYTLFHIWKFDCNLLLKPPPSTSVEVVRFIEEFARQFEGSEFEKPLEDSDYSVFDRITSTYVHYGEGHSPRSLLFPTIDEFLSLPMPVRATIVRSLLSLSKMIWAPTNLEIHISHPASNQLESLFKPSVVERKEFFKALVTYFFLLIPDLQVNKENKENADELSIFINNKGKTGVWNKLNDLIPVYCQDWQSLSPAEEMAEFVQRVINSGFTSGIYISLNAFSLETRETIMNIATKSFRNGLTILPLDINDLSNGLRYIDPSKIIEIILTQIRTNKLKENKLRAIGAHRKLKVFLCHSSDDKSVIRNLYQRLWNEDIQPWLDEKDILPGQEWDRTIKKAVQESDVILVCLTKKSIAKSGYLQKEITYALDVAAEKPQGSIFLIPLRLEECPVPDRLSAWQWVNYYDVDGFENLMKSLKRKEESLNN